MCAFVGHLVGDYLLQNDWLAREKKNCFVACMMHCNLWALSVCVFAGWFSHSTAMPILVVLHFLQDRWNFVPWWMRLIGQWDFMRSDKIEVTRRCHADAPVPFEEVVSIDLKPGFGPWSIIVVDNVFHIVTLFLVWRFVI